MPESPSFLKERVSGPKAPIALRTGKGGFSQKFVIFPVLSCSEWRILDFPGRTEEMGVLEPQTLLSIKDLGPCLRRDESQMTSRIQTPYTHFVAGASFAERSGFQFARRPFQVRCFANIEIRLGGVPCKQ